LDLILSGLPSALTLEREHLANNLTITLGSSSAIFAHNLSSLGSKVGFSSSIGSDPFGEICLQRLGASGVDLSHVRSMKDKTTGLTVILPQGQQRYILTYPGTMFEFSRQDLDLPYIFDAKHLHVSSYFLQKALQPSLPDIFRRAKDTGLTTSLDTNDDPEDRWSSQIQPLLAYVDVLLPNEREACKLAQVDDVDLAAERLSEIVPVVVIKRGSHGVLARVSKEKFLAFPPKVDVADHVGAGDSFDAGFLHQLIRGAKIEDCLAFGNIVGALSVTRHGGTEAFRDAQHRDSFLRAHLQAAEAGDGTPASH
ncbi:MAG: carbohydrate kinase family protein, partial [Candidatus Acidiferrum sp.]